MSALTSEVEKRRRVVAAYCSHSKVTGAHSYVVGDHRSYEEALVFLDGERDLRDQDRATIEWCPVCL